MWAKYALLILALCGHPVLALQVKNGWHFAGPLPVHVILFLPHADFGLDGLASTSSIWPHLTSLPLHSSCCENPEI